MQRPSLESIYMNLAMKLAERSSCKRIGHGCVITSQDLESIYALGYNGTARGFDNNDCRNEVGNCGCIHSETNAIAKVHEKDNKKVFFVTGEPCELCAKLMINSGIIRYYYIKRHPRPVTGIDVLKRAGILVIEL